ncbi:hypothetical protein M5D96_011204 [Drosophila gunungcola]|uniref:Uncharacterized protein n=1 Tax=Drosophila gunungcola TaxID=103775 RepID=A0A9P9YFG0_9MUSC|nr:hypothetical protein M5D96_011204 [Drosophila gunungcola]
MRLVKSFTFSLLSGICNVRHYRRVRRSMHDGQFTQDLHSN